MNSYLDLVKEYAEKHKRKNRMSLFVILLAVALVATIFGMADMELQTQQISMKKQYGSWHIGIKDMAKEQEQIVALRPQIAVSGYLESVGSRSGYTLFGKAANILGVDEALAKELGIRLRREPGRIRKRSPDYRYNGPDLWNRAGDASRWSGLTAMICSF